MNPAKKNPCQMKKVSSYYHHALMQIIKVLTCIWLFFKGYYKTDSGSFKSVCDDDEQKAREDYVERGLEQCSDIKCEGAYYFNDDDECKPCPKGFM